MVREVKIVITYEEAYKKAKELKPLINNCTEYENGYVFGYDDGSVPSDGGGNQPCVILKEDGSAVVMPWFVINGTGKEIRDLEIDDNGNIVKENIE